MGIAIWAHRGASGYAPENTLEAFALAAELGADGVELDVHLTADRQLVVTHDEDVRRATGHRGAVAALTLAELKALNFSRPLRGYKKETRIPTLGEVYELLKPTGLVINVELKNSEAAYPGLEQACLALAKDMGMEERLWYSSFNHYSMQTMKKERPDVRCGLLYGETMVRPWDYARALGVDALHPVFHELKVPGEVAAAHTLGLRVHAWTVNTPRDLAWVAATGLDAIITNYPDRARATVGKRKQ